MSSQAESRQQSRMLFVKNLNYNVQGEHCARAHSLCRDQKPHTDQRVHTGQAQICMSFLGDMGPSARSG